MDILFVVTFFVAFLSSIVSGISGGGGGFIMTPYFVFIGLSPQQIVGNAAVASLGLGSSSLLAMRGKQLIAKRFLWPLLCLTVIATLLAMTVLPHINSELFQSVVGILLILLAPTLFIQKTALQPGERSKKAIVWGYIVYGSLLFGGALGSGLATLVFLPLMFLMGLTALEANATRRLLAVVQAVVMCIAVLPRGYVVWGYALASLAGCYLGGHIGTKIALKKGDTWVKIGLAVVMCGSGLGILLL